MDEIKFRSIKDEYGFLSNFYKSPLILNDCEWPTSEHYFQAQKFAGTKYETAIRHCKNAMYAANMGHNRSLPLRSDWEQVKNEIMYNAVKAKFLQNKYIKEKLLSTGDSTLVEHTNNNWYWGDGGNGQGKNILGKILMKVREELRRESHS